MQDEILREAAHIISDSMYRQWSMTITQVFAEHEYYSLVLDDIIEPSEKNREAFVNGVTSRVLGLPVGGGEIMRFGWDQMDLLYQAERTS